MLREETGMTVLMTTHYMEEADALCDRVALMHRGRVRALGTPDELKVGSSGAGASLEDVFRHHTGDTLDGGRGDMRQASAQTDAPPHRPLARPRPGQRPPRVWRRSGSRVVRSAWSSSRSSGTTARSSTRARSSPRSGC